MLSLINRIHNIFTFDNRLCRLGLDTIFEDPTVESLNKESCYGEVVTMYGEAFYLPPLIGNPN